MDKRMVVVTTDKKGVFYGELVGEEKNVVDLASAKMCIYWGSDLKGVFGLAKTGPTNSCRISPEILKIKLYGVTSIMDCGEVAIAAWEVEQWS